MTQELRPLTPEQEAEVRASIHQGREPELLFMLDASRAAHREAIARAERAEALAASRRVGLERAIGEEIEQGERRAVAERERNELRQKFDALVTAEVEAQLRPHDAEMEKLERERDEAQAVLVGLRERVQFMLDRENPNSYPRLRAALAATPASLAGLVRGRVLREAADRVSHHPDCGATECSPQTCNVDCEQFAIRRMADEAEKGTDR